MCFFSSSFSPDCVRHIFSQKDAATHVLNERERERERERESNESHRQEKSCLDKRETRETKKTPSFNVSLNESERKSNDFPVNKKE
jgi:hypothetical protein